MAVSAPISALLGAGSRTVASCLVYLFKSIPINEPFGPNTLDKDRGGQGSTPVELFTRGQRTSALLKRLPPPPSVHYKYVYPTSRGAFLCVGYVQKSKPLGGGLESMVQKHTSLVDLLSNLKTRHFKTSRQALSCPIKKLQFHF